MTTDPKITEFATHLAQRAGCGVVHVADLAAVISGPELPEAVIVVIAGGMQSLASTPRVTGPLLEMARNNLKTIIVDDIDSFLDISQVKSLAERSLLPLEFLGYTRGLDGRLRFVTILSSSLPEEFLPAPADFRVVAIVSTYNEADVITPTVRALAQNQIGTYIVDNWSTDGTFEKAAALAQEGVIGLERWPPSGPSATFDLKAILHREEELSRDLDADWFLHQDADEIRQSPWEHISFREAIYFVDRQGYNAIDFTLLEFRPIDNAYRSGLSLQEHFRYFTFDVHPGYLIQVKAWKRTGEAVDLSSSGGHMSGFPGRRIFPYNFLLKHYPIRSQEHGERKILRERQARAGAVEQSLGWNVHYNAYTPASRFLRNPKGLIPFDDSFPQDYLLERLARTGIPNGGTVTGDAVAAAEQESARLQDRLSDRERDIARLQETLAEREHNIARLQEMFSDREHDIVELRGELTQAQHRIAQLMQALSDSDAQLLSYARSASWRLTRPLRRLRQWVRLDRTWIEYIVVRSSGLFDPVYYQMQYADVRLAGIDPLMHYLTNGWREGRNPSREFNTNAYLDAYPDVREAGTNPLFHYVRHGRKEGRQIDGAA